MPWAPGAGYAGGLLDMGIFYGRGLTQSNGRLDGRRPNAYDSSIVH